MSNLGFSVVLFFFSPCFLFFDCFLFLLLGLALKDNLCVQGLVEDPNLLSCAIDYAGGKKQGKA